MALPHVPQRMIPRSRAGVFDRFSLARTCWFAYIKVADRILNLQEGKTTLPRKRWAAIAQEARQHVIPLLNDLPKDVGSRLFFVLSFSMFRNKRRGRRRPEKKNVVDR